MSLDAWFPGWGALVRTLLVGTAAYLALVLVLRASGKRTLAKLNAFDLVVTVALGSTLASVLTSRDVAWAQGAVAFALLAGLQFALTWLSVRSPRVAGLVRAEPALLVHRGVLLHGRLRAERVTPGEVESAVRASGLGRVEDAESVMLETDGSLSVVTAASPRRAGGEDAPRGTEHPEVVRRANQAHGDGSPYARFLSMVLVSTAVMFALMYSLVFRWEHVRFSDTRFLMALSMGAAMAVVMFLFMRGMYPRRAANAILLAGAAVVFGAGLHLARSQRTVGDVAYMKAMIPHHSIAILTSARARLGDPRVRRLADRIIASQEREIAEMDSLIRVIEGP